MTAENIMDFKDKTISPTVQQKLEEALSTRFQKQIVVHPSGRTDAGVHAIAQVVHFDVDSEIKTSSFGYSLNTLCQRISLSLLAKRLAKIPCAV